jgi:hypothetical protein
MSVLSRAILTVLSPCVAATCCHSCDASHHFPGTCTAEQTQWIQDATQAQSHISSVQVSGSRMKAMTRFLFSVCQSWVSWCMTPSLTRGWACNLLLGFARALTVGFKSPRTRDHILLSHLLSQPGVYITGRWVLFSSPLTTRKDYGGSILTRLHSYKYGFLLDSI